MDLLQNLYMGFSISLTPINILYCLAGCFFGQIVGVLPGIGAPTAVALLLPLTFSINPTSAIIMFAGIYYGVAYGGTITSVLINVPGESSTVMTCIDGYQMALKGRAGAALSVAAVGSWIAGTISVAILMCFAPALAKFALRFGPAEFFGLAFMSFGLLTVFGADEPIKTIISTLIGLLIATIGLDVVSGMPRFAFGIPQLLGGFDFIVIICGIFGLAEVFNSIEEPEEGQLIKQKMRLKDLFLTKAEWIASRWAIVRGGIIGFFTGIIPAGGITTASFLAYLAEKRISKHPERFGKGAIEGVACTRGGEQCRLYQRFCSVAGPGDSGFSDDGCHAGRLYDVGDSSRASAFSEQTGPRLGPPFKQVHRESHPPPDEHLSHPALCHDPASALYDPDVLHCDLRSGGRLHRQQQLLRCLDDARIRCTGLYHEETQLSDRAPGLGPGSREPG